MRFSRGSDAAWEAATRWARSGVMSLCGTGDGPPLLPPLAAALRLSEVVGEIERITASEGLRVRVSWEAALAGRAAVLGFDRAGRTSANGTCRLLPSADGEIAISLARPSDLDLVPALLELPSPDGDVWQAVTETAAASTGAAFVDRGRLLGMAAASPGERQAGEPYRITRRGDRRLSPGPRRGWTVVDLSSLWAGPLAARILGDAGASIVKVEDRSRPDGARNTPAFYRWLHSTDDRTVELDFGSTDGRTELAELLASADVVIEASRPRALEQMGLSPAETPAREGQVWLSITAHGRSGPPRNWVGFGDDAAVAGGFVCRDAEGRTVFCGDAIADPITGLTAALAVLRSRERGGGQLIDVSLAGASAWAASGDLSGPSPEVVQTSDGWSVSLGHRSVPVAVEPAAIALTSTS